MGDVLDKVRQFNALQIAAKMKWDSLVAEAIGDFPQYTTEERVNGLLDSTQSGALRELDAGAEDQPKGLHPDP